MTLCYRTDRKDPMKRALICDLDMTLIDSRKDIAEAVAFAISDNGLPPVTAQQVYPWIGKGLRNMFLGLLGNQDSEHIEALTASYKKRFYDHCAVHTTVYPGVLHTLEALHKRGIKLAIATAKMTFMGVRVCQVFGLDRFLSHIQGTDDMPGKPDPTVLLLACKALGISPEQAVFVGDTVMDVQAAQRAGCTSVAVTYGIGDRGALAAQSPDRLFDSFSDVLQFFPDGHR